MRRILVPIVLSALALNALGCGGEPPKATGNPAADNPNMPGVPTDGPEAPKAAKK